MVDMNKELLHAGYRLHLVFDEMVQDIRKDPDNWIMIIEKNIDQISSLISEYHKIAATITTNTRKNGLPVHLKSASDDTLKVMDGFNDEILTFDNFVENSDHIKAFTKFFRAVNYTNELLLELKLQNK
ncbi:hypothetical protein E4T70_03690 [Lactobacillus johnsonii]|jgi:hypothetical protein|uniref:hypothetical protein n=1 Tax=Lactobacillus johnsonii TaxID=33959 RepID=UPI00069E52C0|nr:hypothetical protein [Lactobacillus johnsonii]KOH01624.1 hypothetical protein LJ16_08070 [Lactobacillus johnsonii 16]MBF0771340.1 hypothetical protein [Lactobacillus johnsonii]MCF1583037.1 hypothetical protein [Lactobacillus johnsonii]MCI9452004.1 hypothetical protein [Lactobacillus johnsonii]MDG4988265.1 hypothetical protein [Lactobacillus johnsonii]